MDAIKKKGRRTRPPLQPAELQSVSRAAALIRSVFGPWCRDISGHHLTARLAMPLMKAVRGDTRNAPGRRCVADGHLRRLEGFEFNEAHCPPMPEGLRCQLLYAGKSDRVLVKTAGFTADALMTRRVARATHFKAGLIVAAIPLDPRRRARLFKCIDGSQPVGQRDVAPLLAAVDLVIDELPVLYCAALAVSYYRFGGSQSCPYDQGRQDLLRLVKVFSA